MNAEEIRIEASRRTAKAIEDHQIDWGYGAFYSGCCCGWDVERKHEGDWPQHVAAAVADALGDILPTGVETSISYDLACVDGNGRIRRFVCPWQEVTE